MRRRFIVGSLFVLLFALGWWAGRGSASNDLYARLDTFIEVLHRVEDSYVERVDPEPLIAGAAGGMMRRLDPWSDYLDPRALRERLAHEGGGSIGLTIDSRPHPPRVLGVVPGSPADRAGIRAGDRLLEVDGHSTGGWTQEEQEFHLSGAPGSAVRVLIAHGPEDSRHESRLVRVALKSAPSSARMLEHGIGCLRLAALGDSGGPTPAALLARLQREGATSLVLDLRGCTGGDAQRGADLAALFLGRGAALATLRGHGHGNEKHLTALTAGLAEVWPLVVLVDGATAGAAEIATGALQDLDRALVLGHTTYGRASQQTDYPLMGGTARLRLTTAVTLTPLGRPIDPIALAAAADDEEGDGADSTVADSSGRHVYRTKAGRALYGGNGLEPDRTVPDSLLVLGASASNATTPDAAVRQALGILQNARAPRDVFAAVPTEAPRH